MIRLLGFVFLCVMVSCKYQPFEGFITRFYEFSFSSTNYYDNYYSDASPFPIDYTSIFSSNKIISLAFNDINISDNQQYFYVSTDVYVYGSTNYEVYYYFDSYYTMRTSLRISVIFFDKSYSGFTIEYHYVNYYSGSMYTGGNISVTTLQPNTKAVHFLRYFEIHNSNINYPFTLKSILQTVHGKITMQNTVDTSSSNSLYFGHSILIIDIDYLRTNYLVEVDTGFITGNSGSMDYQLDLGAKFMQYGFMIGINSIILEIKTTYFWFEPEGTFNIQTGSFDFLNVSYINVRKQLCPYSTPYYITINSTCVATCPSGFYADIDEESCQICPYQCQTCNKDGNCLTCSSTNKRTLSGTLCPCDDGFFDNSVAACSSCISNCVSCTNGTECVTCSSSKGTYTQSSTSYQVSYIITSTKTCQLCSSLMSKCIECSAYNECTKCTNTNLTISADKASCVCNSVQGYWASGADCVLCPDLIFGCLTCTSATSCSSCDPSKKFVASGGACVCENGYVMKGNKCCHYSCLTCSTPDQCLTCDINKQRSLVSTSCKCSNKYFDDKVQLCKSCQLVCATCDAATTCLTCQNSKNLTLLNNNCVCIPNFVLITDYCRMCSQVIIHCISCNSKSSCRTCFSPNYTLSTDSSSCDCSTSQQYFLSPISPNCYLCTDLIFACVECSAPNVCVSCVSNFTTSADSSTCVCDNANNFYPIGINCPHCFDLIIGCQTCSANNTCNKCFDTNYTMGNQNYTCECSEQTQYFSWNGQCPFCRDIIIGCIDCQSNDTCVTCDTVGFFRIQGQRCVCIDGYFLNGVICQKCQVSCLTCVTTATYCLTCNNTALRFFQNNNCVCRQHFSDCRNSSNNLCDDATCSFLNPLQLTINSIIKDPSKNTLQYSVKIYPALSEFDGFDFYQLFNIGLPSGTSISYTYLQGIVTANVQYYSNMQGNWTNVTFDINQTGYWYFQLAPQSIQSYEIAPTNNLASNNYSEQLYQKRQTLSKIVQIISISGLIVFMIGLFSNKIVASQMVAVMQISYIGLFIVNFSDPLINSLNLLEYTNGINDVISTTQHKVPNRIFSTGYTSSTISNLNIMMCLLMIPPVLSLVFYLIHKNSVKYRIRMEKNFKLALGEGIFTAVLFILYNYSCSIVTVMFSNMKEVQFFISLLELLVISIVFALALWIFLTKDKIWIGEYKSCFNWNKFSERYYLYPTFQRFVIGILLTAGNASYVSAIIAILIILGNIIIIAWKKPFIHNFQNRRSILVNLYSILILGLYTSISINGPSSGESAFTYFPYIIIGIVAINIFTGLSFIILHFLINCKKQITQQLCDKQENVDAQMKMEMNKNVQKMLKQAKHNNINSRLLLKAAKRPKIPNIPLYETEQQKLTQQKITSVPNNNSRQAKQQQP